MKKRAFCVATAAAAVVVSAGLTACGEDEAIVRQRSDGGNTTDSSTIDGGPMTLPCGVTVRSTYESPAFLTNAKVELDLRKSYYALDVKMRSAEGTEKATVTAAELREVFATGTPSLRAVSSGGAQGLVDTYFESFGAAVGKTWTVADAEKDGGAATGGKFEGGSIVDNVGTDLRQAIDATLLTGVFYHHVLGIVASPVSEVAVDRLVAAFGETDRFVNPGDEVFPLLMGQYAQRFDGDVAGQPGLYRQMKTTFLVAKTAAAAGDKCKQELDAAIASYLLGWEKIVYATAIYHLNVAKDEAIAADHPNALLAFGQALGFIQSYKGIPADKRKINDAQIDALLTKIGAAAPYRFLGSPGATAAAFGDAISDIAAIYGFSAVEVDAFKR